MPGLRSLFATIVFVLAASTPARGGDENATYEGRGLAPVFHGRLFYEVAGAGDAVVLIHGGQLDSRMWDAQFGELARDFRVLRYDVRGFGGSTAPVAPYSYADDLAALLDYLGVPRVHIVGLSLGGMIATDFAVTYPERARSLVLSGPGLTGLNTESAEEIARFWTLVAAARNQDADLLVRLWLEDPLMAPAMEHDELRAVLTRLAWENADAWLNNFMLRRPPQPPTAERLAEIRVPTLVIVGDRDVASIHAVADTIVARVASARRNTLPGVGHMANMEAPTEFNRLVRDFLREVTAAEKQR